MSLYSLVQRLARHPEISTTMRYIHLNDDDVRAAMAKEREEKSGHTSGHTKQVATSTVAN
jgi:hypothetical protein